jgi:hypothetical protein
MYPRDIDVSRWQSTGIGTAQSVAPTRHFSFQNFDQAMRVAASPRLLTAGTNGAIRLHQSLDRFNTSPQRPVLPLLSRAAGDRHGRDSLPRDGMGRDVELWVVNRLFSCLSTSIETAGRSQGVEI